MEKVVSYSHSLLKEHLNCNSVCVDATCGMGHDTLFLAGVSKKVYAFDVQKKAIDATKSLCKDYQNIEYILDGHENLLNYVKGKINGIIFNLGYLPGGEHSLTTQKDTTLKAIKSALGALALFGVMVIVVYPGHPEGKEESLSLQSFVKSLDQHEFDVIKYEFINQVNDPPYLIAIERISV